MMQVSADRPEARLGFLLYRAGLAVSRGYERALGPLGAAPADAGVLSCLGYRGPSHTRALGRFLGLGRQTIVNVTRRLERDGLIGRMAHPEDARLALFDITDAGRGRLAEIEAVARAFDARLLAIVGSPGEAMLVAKLQAIVDDPMFAHDE
jgi:DNA-binding MarR family transcriptional regulator